MNADMKGGHTAGFMAAVSAFADSVRDFIPGLRRCGNGEDI